jgi:hypothetical protein
MITLPVLPTMLVPVCILILPAAPSVLAPDWISIEPDDPDGESALLIFTLAASVDASDSLSPMEPLEIITLPPKA